MKRRLLSELALATGLAACVLSTGFGALAQTSADRSSSYSIAAGVERRCFLGEPSSAALNLGDLTGSDGRLEPALLGSAAIVSTSLANAWCNTPSNISVDVTPLTLQNAVQFPDGDSSGFTRYLTYDARVSGWPTATVNRPLIGGSTTSTTAGEAHANPLSLEVSRLQTLDDEGQAETPNLFVEAGVYLSTVTISVATLP